MVNEIDTFWECFNESRCKTAMLIISIIITLAFVISELFGIQSIEIKTMMLIIIGYWIGRTSKSKDLKN